MLKIRVPRRCNISGTESTESTESTERIHGRLEDSKTRRLEDSKTEDSRRETRDSRRERELGAAHDGRRVGKSFSPWYLCEGQ